MPLPEGWDADRAVAAMPTIGVSRIVWRCHTRLRSALSHEGYRYRSGRFHRGIPDAGTAGGWPALYLSSAPHVCLGEYLRHVADLDDLRDIRMSSLMVNLTLVLDCRDIDALGLTAELLLEDLDYRPGQTLAAAAIQRRCEGLVVPSATRFKDPNLVVFPTTLRAMSDLAFIEEEDPRLYSTQMPEPS